MKLLDTLIRIYLYCFMGPLAIYGLIKSWRELELTEELRCLAQRILGAGVEKWR